MSKTDIFKKELFELMKKHEVTLQGSDQYDSNEDYCGTSYSFQSVSGLGPDGIYLELSEISET